MPVCFWHFLFDKGICFLFCLMGGVVLLLLSFKILFCCWFFKKNILNAGFVSPLYQSWSYTMYEDVQNCCITGILSIHCCWHWGLVGCHVSLPSWRCRLQLYPRWWMNQGDVSLLKITKLLSICASFAIVTQFLPNYYF